MARFSGFRKDEGARGFSHTDKKLVMKGASWLESQSAVVLFEDFLVDVLADTPLVTATQSGTPLTAAAITGTGGGTYSNGHGGWVGGKTDDVDAEIDELAFGGLGTGAGTPIFAAQRAGNGMMVMEMGFVIPTALTARQYFIGWTDDPTEGTGTNGSLNISGSLTQVSPATDAAGFIFSSLATNPTFYKAGAVLNDVDATVLDPATVAGIVDAYTTARVEVDSVGNAYFYLSVSSGTTAGPVPVSPFGSIATAVTPTVNLIPMFTAAPTTTTGVEWEVDYCFAACQR